MIKKYNIKINNILYHNYYLINNLDEYKEYVQELNNKFAIAESEIKNLETFIGHEHSILTGISGMFCGMINKKENREPMFHNLKFLHAQVLTDQLKDILNSNKLAINDKGGYFPIKPEQNFEIEETISYYTEKDIKISKWRGGKHYYAKIGSIDVVVDDGTAKWNSEQQAYNEALKFLKKLIHK